jgi:predicted nucleotidyltransferase
MIHKGRKRIRRGLLTNFYDLPLCKQLLIKKIKHALLTHLNKNINVYIFGSYLKGYWDKYSDYDVLIDEPCNLNLQKQLSKELNVKIEIKCHENASIVYKALLIPD